MDHWVDFYKRTYGFVETRYFDIKGTKTGLNSKVVQLLDNSIMIPINEPEREGGKSQIQEFLDVHKGPGVQHIALMTPDIISTVAELRERDVKFLNVPSTYYEAIVNRPFKVTEDLSILEKLNLLVDGDPEGYLLQIFSDTYIGPLFFEYIQRKNHWGFGNGNFQALFDAIERDQMKRGYL
jgi:4-hydroxyphenylpyruvate dioxygenase